MLFPLGRPFLHLKVKKMSSCCKLYSRVGKSQDHGELDVQILPLPRQVRWLFKGFSTLQLTMQLLWCSSKCLKASITFLLTSVYRIRFTAAHSPYSLDCYWTEPSIGLLATHQNFPLDFRYYVSRNLQPTLKEQSMICFRGEQHIVPSTNGEYSQLEQLLDYSDSSVANCLGNYDMSLGRLSFLGIHCTCVQKSFFVVNWLHLDIKSDQ